MVRTVGIAVILCLLTFFQMGDQVSELIKGHVLLKLTAFKSLARWKMPMVACADLYESFPIEFPGARGGRAKIRRSLCQMNSRLNRKG